jgi:hypothetical protein
MSSEKDKGKSKSSRNLATGSDGGSGKGNPPSRTGSGNLTPTGASPPGMSRIQELKAVAVGRKDSLTEAEEALRRERELLEEEKAKLQRQKDLISMKGRSSNKGSAPVIFLSLLSRTEIFANLS